MLINKVCLKNVFFKNSFIDFLKILHIKKYNNNIKICSFVNDQIEGLIRKKSRFILNLRKNAFILEETNLSSDILITEDPSTKILNKRTY